MDEGFYRVVGENLGKARDRRNISLDQLAELLNTMRKDTEHKISKTMLWRYENAKTQIRSYNFMLICEALNVSPDEVVSPTGDLSRKFSAEISGLNREEVLGRIKHNLRRMLEERGHSENALSDLTANFLDGGIPPVTCYRYLNRLRDMPLRILYVLSVALEANLLDFLKG